ncbi:hypothetical protein JIG36_01365 [Actinoplanes sp. LDG1-06]|uniref:DUF4352 domain-containing protein n=1 Tax=Paractinoplanes ovalisporus TaxID=2810368 RepID=A0ABS2A2Y6_9ACTN|nr:hypothetical protein [Actinoplanes ovalisporus]MBM2614203.1 hypothetical protein [Actinoplanes ovalisporus]
MRSTRTRHWPWITVVAVAVAGAGLSLAYGNQKSPAPVASNDTAAIGTPVTQDGLFEYTVNSVDCDTTCTVGITVKNLGDAARKPGIAFARAYDPQGAEHLADAVAEVRNGTALLDDLAPGARITDRLYYAVPEITSLVLREQQSSTGITVEVG